MFENATNVMQAILSASIATQPNKVAPLPLVNVHSRTIVAKYRLGHESDRLAMFLGYISDHIFVGHQTTLFSMGANLTPNSH